MPSFLQGWEEGQAQTVLSKRIRIHHCKHRISKQKKSNRTKSKQKHNKNSTNFLKVIMTFILSNSWGPCHPPFVSTAYT